MKAVRQFGVFHAAAAATLLIALVAAAAALAAPASEAQAVYDRELAVCASGASPQGRETCIKEAQAAHAENQHGQLNDRSADYQRNASQRCDALQGAEQEDCVARMQGQGTTSGSVASGGVLRELVTRSVEEPKGVKAPD